MGQLSSIRVFSYFIIYLFSFDFVWFTIRNLFDWFNNFDFLYQIADCNNLYGYAMQMPLPEKGFKWMAQEELDNLDILNYDCYGEYGAVLEVCSCAC